MAKVLKSGLLCVLTIDGSACSRAKDVTLKMEKGVVVCTSRASDWKEKLPGLKSWTADVKQLCVFDNAGLKKIEDAYLAAASAAGSTVTCSFLDNAGDGYSGSCVITGLERGEPLEGEVTLNATLRGTGELTRTRPV